jgi:adenylyl-sulfate kinase
MSADTTVEHHGNGAASAGVTIWFTGLSGAGKSTLARALGYALRERGRRVEILDGDEIRENLSKGLGFSREDRDTNIRRIGYVARLLARNDVDVIAAAISPYRAVRDELRRDIPRFVEVYVKATLDECVRRDVKGLYKKALAGEIANFTGVSDPYEEPRAPHLVIDTERDSVADGTARILQYVESLRPATVPGDD